MIWNEVWAMLGKKLLLHAQVSQILNHEISMKITIGFYGTTESSKN